MSGPDVSKSILLLSDFEGTAVFNLLLLADPGSAVAVTHLFAAWPPVMPTSQHRSILSLLLQAHEGLEEQAERVKIILRTIVHLDEL